MQKIETHTQAHTHRNQMIWDAWLWEELHVFTCDRLVACPYLLMELQWNASSVKHKHTQQYTTNTQEQKNINQNYQFLHFLPTSTCSCLVGNVLVIDSPFSHYQLQMR